VLAWAPSIEAAISARTDGWFIERELNKGLERGWHQEARIVGLVGGFAVSIPQPCGSTHCERRETGTQGDR